MTPAVVAALLAALAALVTVPGPPARRPPARRPLREHATPHQPAPPAGHSPTLPRHTPVLAAAAALLPVVMVGGLVGAGLGVAAGVWAWRVLGAMETASVRRRREKAARDLPHVIDLLSVVLDSGASTSGALGAVAAAVDAPLGEELAAVRRGLDLGRDPVEVWRDATSRPGLAGLSRTMVRALDTGASVAPALHRYAADLHDTQRYAAEERARRVGVQVAAPLGLCLLPAFVLVGVVPLVGATVGTLPTP